MRKFRQCHSIKRTIPHCLTQNHGCQFRPPSSFIHLVSFNFITPPLPPLNLRGGWGASHRLSSLVYLASSIDTEKLIKYYFPMRTSKITDIDEMLKMLPETARKEVRDFTAYLLDRERRRKALVDRVLKAEQNPDFVECKNPEEFIQAILNAPDDDEG